MDWFERRKTVGDDFPYSQVCDALIAKIELPDAYDEPKFRTSEYYNRIYNNYTYVLSEWGQLDIPADSTFSLNSCEQQTSMRLRKLIENNRKDLIDLRGGKKESPEQIN